MSNVSIERVKVVIVGSGFAGLCMAIKLAEAGIDDFVILERADAIGGTWRDNHYPGCACDVPAHLYSFSFFPNSDWSSTYAPAPEIRAYMERCASRWQLHRKIRFGAAVARAELDEARATWTVHTRDGRSFVGDVLVSAIGGLSNPLIPKLPGLERFAGPTWHSASWTSSQIASRASRRALTTPGVWSGVGSMVLPALVALLSNSSA